MSVEVNLLGVVGLKILDGRIDIKHWMAVVPC